jgi:VanZ family protein
MHFCKYWLPIYLYAALIFIFSSLSKPPFHPQFLLGDKLFHVIEYLFFGYLAARAFRNSGVFSFRINFRLWALLSGLIYGLSDEFHQLFVSGRQADVGDIVFDVLGTFLGVMLMDKLEGWVNAGKNI